MSETPMDAEMRGFDDATRFVVAQMSGGDPEWGDYFKPPPGLLRCAGCEADHVCDTSLIALARVASQMAEATPNSCRCAP